MRFFPLIILFGLVLACQRRPQPPEPAASSNLTAANVVAQIDSTLIYDYQVKDRVQQIESKFPRKIETHPQKMSLLNEMINVELLAEEALRQGIKDQFEFKAKLADVFIESLSSRARAKVNDDAIRELYLENQEFIDQISARHILFKTQGKSAAERRALKKELESIRKDLLAAPEKFPDIAKEKSQDGSAQQGGELGFFNFSMMVPEFSAEAFRLKKVGDISNIIESKFGFHLIQLSGDRRGLEHSKEKVQAELVRRIQKEELQAEIDRLRKGRKIEIFEKNLAQLSPLPEIINQDPDRNIRFKGEPVPKSSEPTK